MFFAFLFGIMDFGVAFADEQALRSGVRDAARRVSVADTGTDASCNPSTATMNVATRRAMCLVKAQSGLGANDVRVRVAVEQVGGVDAYTATRTIKLCAQFKIRSVSGVMTPFLEGATKVFESDSQIQIERVLASPGIVTAEEPGFVAWDCAVPST